MSGAGFIAIEALRSRVLMDVKTLVRNSERVFFDCIVLERKVYNNDDITIFSVY